MRRIIQFLKYKFHNKDYSLVAIIITIILSKAHIISVIGFSLKKTSMMDIEKKIKGNLLSKIISNILVR